MENDWRTKSRRIAVDFNPRIAGIATSFDIITILDEISLTMYAEADRSFSSSSVPFPRVFPEVQKKKKKKNRQKNKKSSELSTDANWKPISRPLNDQLGVSIFFFIRAPFFSHGRDEKGVFFVGRVKAGEKCRK